MKSAALKTLLLTSLLAVTVLPGGCTSYLDMYGYVYAWRNAPAASASLILQTQDMPSDYDIEPLAGAVITLEQGGQTVSVASIEDGYFHLGQPARGQQDIVVQVEAPGYKMARLELAATEGKYFYPFSVLLAPSD
jgi:hypothetical protein